MMRDVIPAHDLPSAARAPGKCILFGEHAVVHGKPELLLAIDLYAQVGVRPAPELLLNGHRSGARGHRYLQSALARLWAGEVPIDVTVASRIPKASGLGSSAAFVAALATTLVAAHGGAPRAVLAQEAFTIERSAQGVGSPGDTSASVAGGYLTLNSQSPHQGVALWDVAADGRRWGVRRVADPGWTWVVAYSGIPKDTGPLVRAVSARFAGEDGPALLDRFGEVAEDGIRAVAAEDREEVGRVLTRNQELLRAVGVSHPRLEALLAAAGPSVLGAKLTGAGGGGSIVALPREGREVDLVRRLARAGGVPFVVRPAPSGVELV